MVYRVYDVKTNIVFADRVFSMKEEAELWLLKHGYDPSGTIEDSVVEKPLKEPQGDDLWGYDVTEHIGLMWDPDVKQWKVKHWL